MKSAQFLVIAVVLAGCKANDASRFESIARELPAATTAAEKAGVPAHTREIAPSKVAAKSNAASLLKSSAEGLRGIKGDPYNLIRSSKTEDRQRAEQLLKTGSRGISLAVEAAQKPAVQFDRDWDTDKPWNMMFPQYAELRNSAKWVSARAIFRAREGNVSGSMTDLSATYKLGTFAGSEPTIISLLVYIAIDAIATRSVEVVAANRSKDPVLLNGLRSLLKEQNTPIDLWFHLKGEAVTSIAMSDEWGRSTLEELKGFVSEEADLPTPPKGVSMQLAAKAYKVRALQWWTEVAELAKTSTPREFSQQLPDLQQDLNRNQDPSYDLLRFMSPIYDQVGDSVVLREARFVTADALLAVLQFRQRTGKLPASLTETGFSRMDPYSGKPLGYRVSGDSFTVWSVGRNRIDDGGTEGENVDVVAKFPR